MTRRGRMAAVVVVSAALLAPAAAAQVKNWPSESAPRPLKTPPVAFPPYELRTLPNGLRVVVVQHHEQPAVSVRMLVGAGSAQDPAPKLGVANLVASLLDQGTATRSAQQIADAVDSIGGEIMIGAGTDLTFAYVTVLNDRFETALGLLSDLVRRPAFAPEEIERQRQQVRAALQVSYENPDYLATTVFRRVVYGFHPYAFPGSGTPDSIDRLTRGDLVAYHERYYVPNNCILALVGDVAPAEAFAAAERAFSAWERREVLPIALFPPAAPARRVVVIDKPDAVQTEIRVGHLGVRRDSKDFTSLDLAVRVLGGEGANRLQQVLRMQRGLTYSASADLETYRLTGDVAVETNTRTATTGEVLRLIVDEFSRLPRDGVGTRELEDAKGYLAGNFPLSIETPDAISTKVLTALFYGLPLKELETFRDRVNAVSTDDIAQVTRSYLKPDRLSIVLVGDARQFLEQLSRLGFRNVDVVPLADLDLTSPTLQRRTLPLPALAPATARSDSGTRADWEAAKAVVSRAVTACGGAQVVKQIKTVRAWAATVLMTPQGPMRAATETIIEYPSRMRVNATLPQGELVQAYDGGAAWMKDPNGARDAPVAMKDEMEIGLRRDWIALFAAALDDKLLGKRLTDEKGVAGRTLHVVELWADGLPPVRLAIEADTGAMVSLSYESPGALRPERTTESFDDFRWVAGLRIPYKTVVRRGAVPIFERTLTDVEINIPLAPALFKKPL